MLCLIGLETVSYALLLLVAFHAGITLLELRDRKSAVRFAMLLFLATLLRPEAALLLAPVLLLFAHRMRRSPDWREQGKVLGTALLVLLVAGGSYLGWKVVHFASVLPNPFYLKLAGSTWLSPLGTQSVLAFLLGNSLIVASSCASLFISEPHGPWSKAKLPAVLGLSVALLYVGLFLHADTLMDMDGRFMFPLLPLLIYVSVPTLAHAWSAFAARTGERPLAFSGLVIVFVVAFGARDLLGLFEHATQLVPQDGESPSRALMQRELEVANSLASFPDVERVRIAFGDSGVIPYFTGAVWLDVVGINDSVIARSRDPVALLERFFGFEADLVIHPCWRRHGWITNGHGPLGNYQSWAHDPRWDGYRYVGTVMTDDYDLQFLLRTAGARHQELKAFLRRNVVDGWYDVLPWRLGSATPDRARPLTWSPRPRSDTQAKQAPPRR